MSIYLQLNRILNFAANSLSQTAATYTETEESTSALPAQQCVLIAVKHSNTQPPHLPVTKQKVLSKHPSKLDSRK
jgi:hypothetical protein